MSIRRCLVLALVVGGLTLFSFGQSSSPQTTNGNADSGTVRSAPAGAVSGLVEVNAQPVPDTANDDVPRIPAFIGGRGSTLTLGQEMERSNFLRAGINVGAGYDDNALFAPSGQVGNMTYSVFPNIAIERSTSMRRWSFGYAAGLTINQRLSERNQGSHNLNFESEFRLSPHVNLRAAENFSLEAGIFGGGTGSSQNLGAPGINGGLMTPLADRRSSSTVVETNYYFALKDIVGGSASLDVLHYGDVADSSGTLSDSRTAGVSAFWLHELFRRNWAGFSYGFQRITFDPNGETRVHRFALMDTFDISRNFSVSGFIGPEYSDNYGLASSGPQAGQLSNFNDWSVAGGFEIGWRNARTSARAGYTSGVSNGGGILGAARQYELHGAFRRQLLPEWVAGLGIAYGSHDSLTLLDANSATLIKNARFDASLERNIGRALGLTFRYSHDFQTQSGSIEPSQNFDANRNSFAVTLSYQWEKALGR